jgi:hypothetical protein
MVKKVFEKLVFAAVVVFNSCTIAVSSTDATVLLECGEEKHYSSSRSSDSEISSQSEGIWDSGSGEDSFTYKRPRYDDDIDLPEEEYGEIIDLNTGLLQQTKPPRPARASKVHYKNRYGSEVKKETIRNRHHHKHHLAIDKKDNKTTVSEGVSELKKFTTQTDNLQKNINGQKEKGMMEREDDLEKISVERVESEDESEEEVFDKDSLEDSLDRSIRSLLLDSENLVCQAVVKFEIQRLIDSKLFLNGEILSLVRNLRSGSTNALYNEFFPTSK